MWVVYDWSEGVVGLYDTEEKAMKEYEEYKANNEAFFDEEFDGEEELFVAKINHRFHAVDTGEEVLDEDGNKTGDTYWGWKEDVY